MIIPSLDFYNNKIVRLIKGNKNELIYFGYFYEYFDFYNSLKIKKIHIIILDNIFNGFFLKININNKKKIQIGGGFNSKIRIDFFKKKKNIDYILGSVLFNNKLEFKKIYAYYKKKIIISLDCKKLIFSIDGWNLITKISFEKIFLYIYNLNIKKIIYTDIDKDGTLSGIKEKNFYFLKKKYNVCNFIISGGVCKKKEILNINRFLKFDYIIGISLYKFFFKITELL